MLGDAAADARVDAPVRRRRGHRYRGRGEGCGRRGEVEAAAGRGVLGRVAAGRGVRWDCGGGGAGWGGAVGTLCAFRLCLRGERGGGVYADGLRDTSSDGAERCQLGNRVPYWVLRMERSDQEASEGVY